jgi:hypothetical protein
MRGLCVILRFCQYLDYITMTNDELERIWKDAVVTLSRHYPIYLAGGTKENHEKPQDSRRSGRYSYRVLTYKILQRCMATLTCPFTRYMNVQTTHSLI